MNEWLKGLSKEMLKDISDRCDEEGNIKSFCRVDLVAVFNQFDFNKDGYIEKDEFKRLLTVLGVLEDDQREYISEKLFGKANEFRVNMRQWESSLAPSMRNLLESNFDMHGQLKDPSRLVDIRSVFAQFDVDCNGSLSVEELKKILTILKLDTETEYLRFDKDGSNTVDMAEWCEGLTPDMIKRMSFNLDIDGKLRKLLPRKNSTPQAALW